MDLGDFWEWGVGRGHGWLPPKAGVPLDEHARPRYEEAVDLLFHRWRGTTSAEVLRKVGDVAVTIRL